MDGGAARPLGERARRAGRPVTNRLAGAGPSREARRDYDRAIDGDAGAGSYELRPVGRVESPLLDAAAAPKQGNEGAPDAWVVFDPGVSEAMRDPRASDEVFVLTWLHQGRRDVLAVHPRDDPANPELGVFSTRSQDRPNPIGLHRVQVVAIDGRRMRVRNLEAIDGTPVLDVKPVLLPDGR